MQRLRSTYNAISFRGRLLLLLIAVSLVQAAVAGWTFNTLQSKPIDEQFASRLDGSLRAVAPVMDAEFQNSARRVRALLENDALITGVEAKDVAALNELLAAEGAASSKDGQQGAAAYLTDADGKLLAGDRPESPMVTKENLTSYGITRGAELLATLHVPVVLDETFMQKRLGGYVNKGVDLFITVGDSIVTEDSTYPRPRRLTEGPGELSYGDAERYSLVQPLLDGEILIGATVPKSVVSAKKRESFSSLMGFLAALALLMLLVSYVVTRAVGDALKKFAEVARRLASGELNRRIPVTGTDEVAVLAESFNDMAENLELRIGNLIEARAKMRRQVDLFGEALANATDVDEMLTAVCGLAMESTVATHARFWVLDEDGHYEHAACIGLRPNDTEPCPLEKAVTTKAQAVRSDTSPHWLVVPARAGDTIVGLLTLVSTNEPFSDDDVHIAGRVGVQAAVAIDNARMHEQLKMQATRDGLTGLPNHRSLQDQLRSDLKEAYAKGMPLGVALMDIDNFKRINDTYGHPVGDEAIKALGKVLEHSIGEMGMAARYGGEEFVVLMPGCDSDASVRIADRIREDITRIEVPLEDGGILTFTASFGVANVDRNPAGVENAELLGQADVGLYNAKRSGKNKVCVAGPETTVIEMSDAEKARLAARERGDDAGAIAA